MAPTFVSKSKKTSAVIAETSCRHLNVIHDNRHKIKISRGAA
ncbi:hypothetical protein HMPREF9056_00089 [Actinomyces sp. oral taxon 170 str. F0386]|nr:hypothetical protein HMPREF9056_00089 [Actinomyces sp. oral taxon 170 str. F0386]